MGETIKNTSTKIPFKVSARTARLIGRENIATSKGAIIELVKNAYDADSSVAIVFFDNKMMYVIGELSGKVAVLKREKGTFNAVQYILSDVTEGVNGKGSADIHISADGKYLYTSNRLKNDGITIFSIASDGTLKMVGYINTGIHPRNFTITPDDKWIIVTCRDSNSIEFYKRDCKSGMLTPKKEFTINIKKPVFVTIF